MSAQELLQGVCHSGAAASFPWHRGCSLSGFSTGMCHGHHGSAVVTYSSVGGMREYPGFVQFSHPKLFTSQLPTSFIQFITFSSPSNFQFLLQSSHFPPSISLFALGYFLFRMLGQSCPRYNAVAQHSLCCQ